MAKKKPTDAAEQPDQATPPAETIQHPSLGRIIHVTENDGDVAPAIVTRVERTADDKLNLNVCVFHPVMGPGNAFISDAGAKVRHEPGEPGTWCWPKR